MNLLEALNKCTDKLNVARIHVPEEVRNIKVRSGFTLQQCSDALDKFLSTEEDGTGVVQICQQEIDNLIDDLAANSGNKS